MHPALNDRRMARLRVVSDVSAGAANRFMGQYLPQLLWQHVRVAQADVGQLDDPNLQRNRINAEMHLAPLTSVLGPVFLALPFTFTQKFDAGAVHQQVQRARAGSVEQLHLQALFPSAHSTEVWNPPIQVHHAQQTLDQAQTLVQSQAKQAHDAQAELDGGDGEEPRTSVLAVGWGVPLHVFVLPDGPRLSCFEGGVVSR